VFADPDRRGVAFGVVAYTLVGADNRGRYAVRIDATPWVCRQVPDTGVERTSIRGHTDWEPRQIRPSAAFAIDLFRI
jgi:hypothetical protein